MVLLPTVGTDQRSDCVCSGGQVKPPWPQPFWGKEPEALPSSRFYIFSHCWAQGTRVALPRLVPPGKGELSTQLRAVFFLAVPGPLVFMPLWGWHFSVCKWRERRASVPCGEGGEGADPRSQSPSHASGTRVGPFLSLQVP